MGAGPWAESAGDALTEGTCSWRTLRCTKAIDSSAWFWLPMPDGELAIEMVGGSRKERAIGLSLTVIQEVGKRCTTIPDALFIFISNAEPVALKALCLPVSHIRYPRCSALHHACMVSGQCSTVRVAYQLLYGAVRSVSDLSCVYVLLLSLVRAGVRPQAEARQPHRL